jgi:hypothetical protein
MEKDVSKAFVEFSVKVLFRKNNRRDKIAGIKKK